MCTAPLFAPIVPDPRNGAKTNKIANVYENDNQAEVMWTDSSLRRLAHHGAGKTCPKAISISFAFRACHVSPPRRWNFACLASGLQFLQFRRAPKCKIAKVRRTVSLRTQTCLSQTITEWFSFCQQNSLAYASLCSPPQFVPVSTCTPLT